MLDLLSPRNPLGFPVESGTGDDGQSPWILLYVAVRYKRGSRPPLAINVRRGRIRD